MPDTIRTIAIVGPGLIGGSFALGIRKAGFRGHILGVGTMPYIQSAVEVGAIDQISSLSEAADAADLLYLSGTVQNILDDIEQLGPMASPNCIVTDVGSTKQVIEKKATQFFAPGVFVGGHPLAGKEKRGAAHSDPDLFRERPYILTSTSPSPLFLEFKRWLELMGAQLISMEPEQHDATVAFSSHLPQLLSTALAFTLSHQTQLPITSIFGSGLIDMTRLALSPSELWLSILATNQQHVVSAVDTYIQMLKHLREQLISGEIDDTFNAASEYAYFLRNR